MESYFIGFEDNGDKYLGVYLKNDNIEPIVFNTGDFIVDWFNCMKTLNSKSENGFLPIFSVSSQINHLSDYGFSYESGYLHKNNEGIYHLKYFDRTKPNWWVDTEKIEDGLEFFVPDNTWSWEKLKEHCSHI